MFRMLVFVNKNLNQIFLLFRLRLSVANKNSYIYAVLPTAPLTKHQVSNDNTLYIKIIKL